MAKIFDYNDKSGIQALPDLDYVLVTNGAEEYNISLTELFNVHLLQTSHDHSSYTIESQVRDFARQESTIIANNVVGVHETNYDHNTFITSLDASTIANNSSSAAIAQHLIDVDHSGSVSGWSGTFETEDSLVVTVVDGVVVSAEDNSIWYNYTTHEAVSGAEGTSYYDGSQVGSPQAGWTFVEQHNY